MRLRPVPLLAGAAALWAAAAVGTAQSVENPSMLRDHPAIGYLIRSTGDPIATLSRRLRQGELTLAFEPVHGYLRALLGELHVPVSSQVLVYSKTSFQAPRISPRNPRTIYFNDAVAVGWVRTGEVLELIAHDPVQGPMFYTLEQVPGGRPSITRNLVCLTCHTAEATRNVPGLLLGSVYPDADGNPLFGPSYTTDHRTPYAQRWGGWYVTGRHGIDGHLGNAQATDPKDLPAMVTPATAHVTSLEGRFAPEGYLSTGSDVVALMTLEHQAMMQNLITRLGWEARIGAAAGRPLAAAANEFVDYLLFVDEPRLPGPVDASAFAREFAALGPRDRQGRSLRQFDLRTRLMKYPCSYMIHSDAFAALPVDARQAVFDRLSAVLAGAETSPRYAALSPDDRAAVAAILRDTVPGLPPSFARPAPPAAGRVTP